MLNKGNILAYKPLRTGHIKSQHTAKYEAIIDGKNIEITNWLYYKISKSACRISDISRYMGNYR